MNPVPEPAVHPLRAAAAEFAPAPSLEAVARDRLLQLVVALAFIHVALAFAHLLHPIGWDFNRIQEIQEFSWTTIPAWMLAIASAFFLFFVRLLLPRLPLRWAHPLGTFVSTLVVLNALAWFTPVAAPEKTVPLTFAMFSAGCLLFTTRSLLLVVLLGGGGWCWFAFNTHFAEGWAYFGGVLAASCLIAITFQRLHLQAIKQMLRTGLNVAAVPRSLEGASEVDQENEDRFRRWYEATFEGIAIHERGVILEANQSLAGLLRCDAPSLAGQNLLEWFTHASRDMIEESLLLGNFRPFEAVARRSDKTELPVELFTKQLRYRGKNVMVTAFRDITERQRAAAALNVEQQRLQTQYKRQSGLARLAVSIGEATEVARVLDCIVETAVAVLPASGACLIVHDGDSYSLAASDLPKDKGAGFDPILQFSAVIEWIRKNRESFIASDITREDPFRVNTPVSLLTAYLGVPMLDGDTLLGVLFVLETEAPRRFQTDEIDFIDELASRGSMALAKARLYTQLSEANRRLEKQSALLLVQNEQLSVAKTQAEAASDAKSEFLAKISHELRTPMNGVLGMTDYLLTTELDADQRESAETVRDSAERLLKEIDHILDFSRLEKGAFEPKKMIFNVRQLARELAAKAETAGKGKPLAVRFEVAEDVGEMLRGDRAALESALWNLLDNAVRFTERGEVALCVSARTINDATVQLTFAVRDTGRGIAPAAQARLFDPFAQADNSLARDHEGLGLGLAMTHRIAERMQGRIHVESAVGVGSTFSLSVPLELIQAATAVS
jgi:PAS domain S-box-containing protein